jgi:hypothetical protein
MTRYLISFPSAAKVATDEELPIVAVDAHAVIEEAKVAGAYVFAGGILEYVDPVMVSAEGDGDPDIYPDSALTGCPTVLELPTRETTLGQLMTIADRNWHTSCDGSGSGSESPAGHPRGIT